MANTTNIQISEVIKSYNPNDKSAVNGMVI